MNIKKKFVSTLLLTAAFCVSPAINVMAEDATTMQTETLDSAIDNSSEVEGQEAEKYTDIIQLMKMNQMVKL